MNDTPPPQPVNPYEPSTLTTTDVTTTNSDGFNGGGFAVPPGAIEALRQTRPWVLFLAILGAIVTGLMLLGGIGLIIGAVIKGDTSLLFSNDGPAGSGMSLMFLGIIYLILTFIYLYPVLKLSNYARAIKKLKVSGSSADLENALQHQKSFWKFVGILTILMIFGYIILFGVLIAGAANGMTKAMQQQQSPSGESTRQQ